MADEPVIDNESKESKNKDNKVSAPQERRQPSRRPQQRQRTDNRSTSGYRRPSRFQRRKVCAFCVDKVKTIDWKNVDSFRRFMNNNGSIRARRKTGTCAKHQRQLAVAIKRARHLALTPFTDEHVRLAGKN